MMDAPPATIIFWYQAQCGWPIRWLKSTPKERRKKRTKGKRTRFFAPKEKKNKGKTKEKLYTLGWAWPSLSPSLSPSSSGVTPQAAPSRHITRKALLRQAMLNLRLQIRPPMYLSIHM